MSNVMTYVLLASVWLAPHDPLWLGQTHGLAWFLFAMIIFLKERG